MLVEFTRCPLRVKEKGIAFWRGKDGNSNLQLAQVNLGYQHNQTNESNDIFVNNEANTVTTEKKSKIIK